LRPKPWGKIFIILSLSAAVMGLFVWKYLDTLSDKKDGVIGHVPVVLKPLYDIFGEKLYLVLGGLAAVLFLLAGLRAVSGKSDFEK
jgi:hypothetical protein